jgi:hypothetical protein
MEPEAHAVTTFRDNVASVHGLMRFDKELIDLVIVPLKALKERLQKHEMESYRLQPDRIIATLEAIREASSLRVHYEALYNQCLVLLVSYFASAVRELFLDAIAASAARGAEEVLSEKITLVAQDVLDAEGDRARLVAESIADKPEYSWQDMKSIARAFGDYFKSSPPKDETVNNIIAAQALRHTIVHAGAMTDKRTLAQLRSATPRRIWQAPVFGAAIRVTPSEVSTVGESMLIYLQTLDQLVVASTS